MQGIIYIIRNPLEEEHIYKIGQKAAYQKIDKLQTVFFIKCFVPHIPKGLERCFLSISCNIRDKRLLLMIHIF